MTSRRVPKAPKDKPRASLLKEKRNVRGGEGFPGAGG